MAPAYESLKQPKLTENPKENANIFSYLSFWWLNSIFVIGNKRPLENEDLFSLLDEDQTQGATEKLQQTWNEQTRGKRCRLFKALVRMFPLTEYLFLSSIALLVGVGSVLQPLFLSLLLPELINPSPDGFSWTFVYAAGICVGSLVKSLAGHHQIYKSTLLGMRWRSATTGMLLKKVLRLKQTDLAGLSRGHILGLVSSDVQRVDQTVKFLMHLLQSSFQIVFLSFLTSYLFGWKSLSGITFLLFLLGLFVAMGALCATIRGKIAAVTDERLRLLNSITAGIRAVKMYGWEWLFKEKVHNIRRQEIKLLRWKSAILALFSSLLFTSQPIATFISLITLAATGTELTSYNTFMILSVVSILRTLISWYVARAAIFLADFSAAVKRIQALLEFGESSAQEKLRLVFTEEKRNPLDGESMYPINPPIVKDQRFCSTKEIVLQDVVCSWTGNRTRPTLQTLRLKVPRGDLVVITGPVGCGKSSLLFAILKELPAFKGHVTCHGKIAYVSQQPWVFCGTVQDNILFGQPLDPQRYDTVLRACDLHEDIQRFPDGNLSRIGEHGIVLSGGQRARVCLARAVYSDADIYLLDDPLSAVDAKVGKHIFEKCISGFLSEKTRLLVTHTLQLLQNADRIVLMREGSIVGEGDYDALSKAGFELKCEAKHGMKEKTQETGHRNRQGKASSDENTCANKFIGLETVDEDRLTGSVSWTLYWKYMKAGVGATPLVGLILFIVLAQGSLIVPDWWLLQVTQPSHDHHQQAHQLYIYGGLVGAAFLLTVTKVFLAFNALLSSSNHLYDFMMSALLKAPVLFFDTNPAGRVLNRFSRDIGIMDEFLPDAFIDAVQIVLFCLGALTLLSVLNPWVILGATPLVVVFILIGRYYLKTSRELKRLEALNRSPVFSHFSETLEGLVTIRTYQREKAFMEELFRRQDQHNRAWFMIQSASRWLAMRLDMLCIILVVVVLFGQLAVRSAPGVTALSLVYALQLVVDTSYYGVIQCSEVESFMTSVERVITYTEIPPEPGYDSQSQPPTTWPDRGQVRVQNLGLVYYEGGPQVLKDVSFTINPCEKVAIAGRTGAGKSSVVAALFHMPQPSGDVMIDDVNINSLNIQSSRRAMSVITQNPVLFTGSLRMNLDPFEEHEDAEIWAALEEASLKATVEKLAKQLNDEVRESGGNLSVGERQLLCLARALLKKSKIIVMDEATANVDYKTDQLIQETIRTKFSDCTVITIAHRLNTILDYDRVLVLDNGRVVEFDKPDNLLKNEDGVFKALHSSFNSMTSDINYTLKRRNFFFLFPDR